MHSPAKSGRSNARCKMCAYKLCLFVLVHLLGGVYGQREIKFFRNDYKFIESTEAFYKIHTIHKTWRDAKRSCAAEGATLFYPEDQSEAEEVIRFMNDTTPFHWVFIGVSDVLAKGVYESIDGVPISSIYHNWAIGEPNGGNDENCVILRRDGFVRDESCAKRWPFVCKKPLVMLQWNKDCNMPNMNYKYSADLGKCYKFHLNPLNWTDAFAACSAEQSYLAVINSQREADEMRNMTAAAPKENVEGDYLRGAVHLGFHNREGEGWQTTKGTSLADSGYANWSYTQPDGKGAEKCGSMFYDGYLNDIGCEQRLFFICEHDIDSLVDAVDSRFSVDENVV